MQGNLFSVAALLACAGSVFAAPSTSRSYPVAMRHLGRVSGDVGYRVLRSEADWRGAFSNARGAGRVASPSVDWAREMVIVAGSGEKPTAGYGVLIRSVRREGQEIVATVREFGPAPDAMVAQVLTYPADAVAVRRLSGPVVFVVNGVRRAPVRPGVASGADISPKDGPGGSVVGSSQNLATSLFVVRETGGIAGLDRQTVVRLYGRALRPGEVPEDARQRREVKVSAAVLRGLEQAVRDSGFMDLGDRYAAPRTIPDGMARTIRVTLNGRVKTVSAEDGATVPDAFETVWRALQNAIKSPGTTVRQ